MILHPSTRCVCVLLSFCLVGLRELPGQEQPAGPDSADNATETAPKEVLFTETIETGFVFIGAEYLPLPYLVEATTDAVSINGRVVATAPTPELIDDLNDVDERPVRSGFDGPRRGFGRGRGSYGGFAGRGRGGEVAFRRRALSISDALHSGAVLIEFPDRTTQIFWNPSEQYCVLSALLSPGSASANELSVINADRERWSEWLAAVDLSPELSTRAEELVSSVKSAEAESFAVMRANRRLDFLAYPLTVLGMLLGVIALGHLLKSYSVAENAAEEGLLPPEVLRATTISIGLLVALSLFDLTWTILASQAGQMRELNPLGSRLIDDPTTLIAFKFMSILVGCGLLYALRHHRRARQACWWLCLVCTVLTFRWVMFNSMFVA